MSSLRAGLLHSVHHIHGSNLYQNIFKQHVAVDDLNKQNENESNNIVCLHI